MKMLSRTYLFLMAIFLFGCNNHSNVEWPDMVKLPMNIKIKAIELDAQIVQSSYDFMYAKDFFVYQDSILIVSNKASTEGYFIEFYNMETNKILNQFIRKGNGPREMLNTLAHVRENQLFVHDFAKNQSITINIDSVLLSTTYQIPKPLKFSDNVGSPFVTFFSDNKLIMENPFCFYDKKLNIDNRAPRFVIANKDGDTNMKLSDYRYYTYNVSQGLIIPNPSKNRLIYASSFFNELEIYDMSLNPIRLITGPDKLEPTYRLDGENEIVFDQIVPYTYMGFSIDEDYFYLSYVGDYFTKNMKLQDFKSWIFRFDWNGNLIDTYSLPEYVNCISKSPKENTFYGRGFDKDGTVVLWKLSIPNTVNK